MLRRATGVKVDGTVENLEKRFYCAGGSWYGNDTIWRMVYDLNRIVRYVGPEGGHLRDIPQRAYVTLVDGLVAGEGNGPLQPLPVELGVVIYGDDPFAVDWAMARLMGFEPSRIPILSHMKEFSDPSWGQFVPEKVRVEWNGVERIGLNRVPVLKKFISIPSWRGHIETTEVAQLG